MIYRDFHIEYDPPPIGTRQFDYAFSHGDYDGPGDSRCGTAASFEQAKEFIDEILADLGYLDPCPGCGDERVDSDHTHCDACRFQTPRRPF